MCHRQRGYLYRYFRQGIEGRGNSRGAHDGERVDTGLPTGSVVDDSERAGIEVRGSRAAQYDAAGCGHSSGTGRSAAVSICGIRLRKTTSGVLSIAGRFGGDSDSFDGSLPDFFAAGFRRTQFAKDAHVRVRAAALAIKRHRDKDER